MVEKETSRLSQKLIPIKKQAVLAHSYASNQQLPKLWQIPSDFFFFSRESSCFPQGLMKTLMLRAGG